jgi:hypothetical protein
MKLTRNEQQKLRKMIEKNSATLVRLARVARENHDAGYASCFPLAEVQAALTATMHTALRLGL